MPNELNVVHSILARDSCLVVIAGVPGSGRTTVLRQLAENTRKAALASGDKLAPPIYTGGGLATLRHIRGLALSRALRVPIPDDDLPLAIEAVRTRVRNGILVLDDLQWVDSYTLQLLPELAKHCRVLVALRIPSGLNSDIEKKFRDIADSWYEVLPLDNATATGLARAISRHLSQNRIATIVERSGGNPLVLHTLARLDTPGSALEQRNTAHTLAAAIAVLTRPARTALAVLGLLGRPASPALLGPGVAELIEYGWAVEQDGDVAASSPYLAQVAVSVLSTSEKTALHQRLAELADSGLVGVAEAAQHWKAGGQPVRAYEQALLAAEQATTSAQRASLVLLAAEQSCANDNDRLTAASAALTVGQPRACLQMLDAVSISDVALACKAKVLKAEALLQLGEIASSVAILDEVAQQLRTMPDAENLTVDWVRVRAFAAVQDLGGVQNKDEDLLKVLESDNQSTVANAVIKTALRAPQWSKELYQAARKAVEIGNELDFWQCGWLLVTALTADGELIAARDYAIHFGQEAVTTGAYSWHTKFQAVELWCTALMGEDLDQVITKTLDLLDHALPEQAVAYGVASACLALADTGALTQARARLANAESMARHSNLLTWVAAELSWLDGQPEKVGNPPAPSLGQGKFNTALHELTARWAATDLATSALFPTNLDTVTVPNAPVATLRAWRTSETEQIADPLLDVAQVWRGSSVREEVRCLLAANTVPIASQSIDSDVAMQALLAAEKLAEQAGLVVLLGRVRRQLRRYAIHRNDTERKRGSGLTVREQEILQLVALGEPTRRIAVQLGISRMTVETHIRAAVQKLGARTRTEAASLLAATSADVVS